MKYSYQSNLDRLKKEGISITIAPSTAGEGDSCVTMCFKIDSRIAEVTVDKFANMLQWVASDYLTHEGYSYTQNLEWAEMMNGFTPSSRRHGRDK